MQAVSSFIPHKFAAAAAPPLIIHDVAAHTASRQMLLHLASPCGFHTTHHLEGIYHSGPTSHTPTCTHLLLCPAYSVLLILYPTCHAPVTLLSYSCTVGKRSEGCQERPPQQQPRTAASLAGGSRRQSPVSQHLCRTHCGGTAAGAGCTWGLGRPAAVAAGGGGQGSSGWGCACTHEDETVGEWMWE